MGRLGFCLCAGTLVMIIGGLPLFWVYAFASMGVRDHQGWDYWTAIFERMFDFEHDSGRLSVLGLVIFLSGAALFLYGIFAAIVDCLRWIWRTK